MHSGNSLLSSIAVTDPSLLRVNVIIARSVQYNGSTGESIEAFIRDEFDKPVANKGIVVKVNGQILTLNSGSSNAYGAYPNYQLTDLTLPIEAETPNVVTLMLTDGREYTLGTIHTLPAITPDQFSPPSQHSRRQPLTLSWQDLERDSWMASQWKRWQGKTSATTLKITKINWANDQWNNVLAEQGSADVADYLGIPISAGQQLYTIPVSFFEGPLARFNTLELQIDSENNLIVPKPFREGSTISSVNSTVYKIEMTE